MAGMQPHRVRTRDLFTSLTLLTAVGAAGVGATVAIGGAKPSGRLHVEPVQRAPMQRSLQGLADPRLAVRGGWGPARFPKEFRSIDGSGNHPVDVTRGAAGTPMIRTIASAYADGVGAPAGAGLPSPRVISNIVMAQATDRPDELRASDMLWQWGQFLDHDIVETPIASPAEPFDIPVPAGDPWFDPFHTGEAVIPLNRSAGVMVDGVRQQVNHITACIDASQVYGSEPERLHALRTLDGTGRLLTSEGDLMPFNTEGLPNAPSRHNPALFLAGDIRANEQTGLIALHTLFVREHNHWAGVIAEQHPEFDGDTIFEHARAIVGAEMQAITYNEFLPLLLGPDAMPEYAGWRPEVDGSIDNLFATAAFRVGHTMLSASLQRLDEFGEEAPEGHLSLAQAFFRPDIVVEHGIDTVLRGLAAHRAQAVDRMVVDDVRNMLFGPPGAGGFDLASLNIQRGRDHGLPSYNTVREAVGRGRVTDFDKISDDPAVVAALAEAYAHPDDIDAWVGLLAEPRKTDAMVGETLVRLMADQFARLRDGDRFWYQSYLPRQTAEMIDQQTLAVIIRRNTTIGTEMADDVFRAPNPCPADVNEDGLVNFTDVLEVFSWWGEIGPCPGDLDGNHRVDVADLLFVLSRWGSC